MSHETLKGTVRIKRNPTEENMFSFTFLLPILKYVNVIYKYNTIFKTAYYTSFKKLLSWFWTGDLHGPGPGRQMRDDFSNGPGRQLIGNFSNGPANER